LNRTTYHADIIGDGLHDDTVGIQALLDAGTSAVYLPPPPKEYLISRTLRLHSGQTLRLDPFTVIRLAPRSDTVMITNDDHDKGNESIALIGGIWDMDNRQQAPNPFPAMGQAALTTPYDPARFIGVLMRFNRVRNLTLQGLTLRDPTTFGAQLGNLYQFTVRDITFDYRHHLQGDGQQSPRQGQRTGQIGHGGRPSASRPGAAAH